ncbi:MAG TPA: chemotaxis protein CheW [Candidatus Baltobacteraceae bacterium]|nr:chemotaxis protein CheW [Candidatus Baltobacteraceae bacterium]
MRFAATHKAPHARTEQIILFRCSTQIFAISSASVQEVRSVDSLAGSPMEIDEPSLPKVRHMFRRGEQNLYVVNGAVHFGLRPSPASLIFLFRRSRTALLIDGIEKMTTMSRLQALPAAFCNEERVWYRGLTVLDQSVIPVVSPEGFLTADELFLLDALVSRMVVPETAAVNEMGLGL